MSSQLPKAVLYYNPLSVWSSTVLIVIEEKGYGQDEIDLKVVDLAKGENFSPSFLRLNPKATVPTLVVPLSKTLHEDVESRYKAITDTKAIAEFLDKSRSPLSHTHTTSRAPAPTLTPATIAFTSVSRAIIDEILHADAANPNNLLYLNAFDDASLQAAAKVVLPLLNGRNESLSKNLADAESGSIQVSEKVKAFWKEKKAALEVLLPVFTEADTPAGSLSPESQSKRAEYFKTATSAWQVGLKDLLTKLASEMVGPFALGEQLSLADAHLAAWLARIVHLSGGSATDDGNTIAAKIEARIGGGFSLPKDFKSTDPQRNEVAAQSKLGAFWDAIKERSSWKKIYGDGLH